MDILTLGLATGGTPVEQVNQVPGEPGFAEALEQVEIGGPCPPGGPPGPEPPPDILLAEEGVEGIEPNARPEKPDFLPLTTVDADIDMPQPLWEEASATPDAEAATETDSKPVEEAMEWLAGQMLGGFFAAPVAIAAEPAPTQAPITSPGVPSIHPPVGKAAPKEPLLQMHEAGKPALTPLQAEDGETEKVVGQTPAPQAPADFESVVTEASGVEAPQVLETLKPTVTTDKETKAETQAESKIRTAPAQAEMVREAQSLAVEEDVLPNTDVLLQKKRPGAKAPAAEDAPKVEAHDSNLIGAARPNAEVAAQTTKSEPKTNKLAAKASENLEVGEATTLQVATKPQSDTSDSKSNTGSNSQLRYVGSVEEDGDYRYKTEVLGMPETDSTEVVRVEGGVHEINAPAPFERAAVVDTKPTSLKPAETDAVVKQLTDRLHMLAAARPRNGVTIHLNPDDLGSITVTVKSIGRLVETQLVASDERVREALDQNRTRLVDAMDARGFNLHTVTVSQQSGHSTQQDTPKSWNQSNQQQNNNSGQSQGQTGHGQAGQGGAFQQPKPPVRTWAKREEGVDLSI